MEIVEFKQGDWTISTDPGRLDVPLIYDFLVNRSYWGRGRSMRCVQVSLDNSLCFGVYRGDEQVGFARVVTDQATFAWLCDVFIVESARGHGLGKWLIECVVQHPALKDIRRIMLATNDAHELYRKYGEFTDIENPERWMQRVRPYW